MSGEKSLAPVPAMKSDFLQQADQYLQENLDAKNQIRRPDIGCKLNKMTSSYTSTAHTVEYIEDEVQVIHLPSKKLFQCFIHLQLIYNYTNK